MAALAMLVETDFSINQSHKTVSSDGKPIEIKMQTSSGK